MTVSRFRMHETNRKGRDLGVHAAHADELSAKICGEARSCGDTFV